MKATYFQQNYCTNRTYFSCMFPLMQNTHMPNFVAVSVTCNATGNKIIALHGETCMPYA